MADAYCLLDVYSVLSGNPAHFGLPADLRSISTGQSEKSRDKKQKEKRVKENSREVKSRFTTFQLIDLTDSFVLFSEVPMDTFFVSYGSMSDAHIFFRHSLKSRGENLSISIMWSPSQTYKLFSILDHAINMEREEEFPYFC